MKLFPIQDVGFYFTENHNFTLNLEIKILNPTFYLIESLRSFLHIKNQKTVSVTN